MYKIMHLSLEIINRRFNTPKIITKETARTKGKAKELKNQKRRRRRRRPVQKTLETKMAEKLAPEKRHNFIHNGTF